MLLVFVLGGEEAVEFADAVELAEAVELAGADELAACAATIQKGRVGYNLQVDTQGVPVGFCSQAA